MSQNLNHKIEKYSHYVSQNPGNQLFLYKLNKYKNQLNNNMNVHVGGVTKAEIDEALRAIPAKVEFTDNSQKYIDIIRRQNDLIDKLVQKINELTKSIQPTEQLTELPDAVKKAKEILGDL